MPGIARNGDSTSCGATLTATQGHTFVNGRAALRLGDPHNHGGSIVSASGNTYVGGIPVARIGDSCICRFHGKVNIVSGSGDTFNG